MGNGVAACCIVYLLGHCNISNQDATVSSWNMLWSHITETVVFRLHSPEVFIITWELWLVIQQT